MTVSNTVVMPYDDAAIAEAARLIRAGQPVAMPTETVYGLAADATSAAAVARIYEAKGRPSFNPLIVHVPDIDAARRLAVFADRAEDLAAQYWPGPLTMVLPRRADAGLPAIVSAGLDTVALRVPAHAAMRALLHACDRPLAAPSANASFTISPTRAEHVLKTLDGRIPLIVDAGPTGTGLESTIVAVDGDGLRLLRPGPIDLDLPSPERGTIEAPGMTDRHYAPAKPLRLDADDRRAGEFLIGFGHMDADASLSPSGDLVEAAAHLFDLLHIADASAAHGIAVALIPEHGLGRAIADRLRRAAHRA